MPDARAAEDAEGPDGIEVGDTQVTQYAEGEELYDLTPKSMRDRGREDRPSGLAEPGQDWCTPSGSIREDGGELAEERNGVRRGALRGTDFYRRPQVLGGDRSTPTRNTRRRQGCPPMRRSRGSWPCRDSPAPS